MSSKGTSRATVWISLVSPGDSQALVERGVRKRGGGGVGWKEREERGGERGGKDAVRKWEGERRGEKREGMKCWRGKGIRKGSQVRRKAQEWETISRAGQAVYSPLLHSNIYGATCTYLHSTALVVACSISNSAQLGSIHSTDIGEWITEGRGGGGV